MALWVCRDCTTAFAVDAPRCPQCGSRRWVEQDSPAHLKLQTQTTTEPDVVEVPADADS